MRGVQGVDFFDLSPAHASKGGVRSVLALVSMESIDAASKRLQFFVVVDLIGWHKNRCGANSTWRIGAAKFRQQPTTHRGTHERKQGHPSGIAIHAGCLHQRQMAANLAQRPFATGCVSIVLQRSDFLNGFIQVGELQSSQVSHEFESFSKGI